MEIQADKGQREVELPSAAETRQAFRVLAASSTRLGKLCLFIEGLDEFEGDYRGVITFLRDLTKSPNIKAIVSSRPIPECVSAFGGACSRLQLHELTRRDMETYVCRSLLSGFDRVDRVAELRRLVDDLPPELKDAFRHMFQRVDKRRRRQCARLLRICHAAMQGGDKPTKMTEICTLRTSAHRSRPARSTAHTSPYQLGKA